MKTTEFIGMLSGLLVIISVVPYSIRVWQKKIKPNVISWSLWAIIGLALLLTYKSSGAEDSIWPAIFGFTNPLFVTILVIIKRGKFGKISNLEKVCLAIGLVSLGMWFYLQENKNLVQYALYTAILADACAAIPTVVFVWRHPSEDRPFAWGLFSVAYGLAIFAIEENTPANYILPLYMALGSSSVALPLTMYRIRNRISLKEWI